ncbi:MAG: CHAP domain-containing protein [Acidimicrobiales bacterium]
MESLATGMLLVSALASPFGATSIRASGGAQSARTVVDGVDLLVRSPALPPVAFVASKPDDVLLGAAAVTQAPYRGFTIYAYPFGSAAPAPFSGIVEPQDLSEYRAMGTGRLIPAVRPSALIFGRRVEGSARVVEVALGPRRQPTEVVSWLTDAGSRLWIIQAAKPLRPGRSVETAFVAGTSVVAGNVSVPTTLSSGDLIRPGPASPMTQHSVVISASTADPPPVRFPPWWNGNCDTNNNPGSFPLSSWDGLIACGPGVNRGGWDRTVAFFPHAWGEYEWECVELSMRWLYLEYGVRPYPADGSQVVANYSRADGGDLRQIANDGSSVPVPGDVLAMEPTWAEGHTAVVTATNVTNGNGTVGILEQNMNGGNGINTLGVIDDVVQPDNGMPVTGWLQAPRSAVFGDVDASLCADAEVATAAAYPGARGRMAIWLHGRSPSQPSSVAFGPLAGENQWTHASTCLTAARRHSDIGVQFYGGPRTPQLGIDAVDVR